MHMSTATITAADINKLRQTTGAGMMITARHSWKVTVTSKKPSTTFVKKDRK